MLAHDRRRALHFNVTANPSAEWTARQMVQAFPEETAPRFLVRDRDQIYCDRFRRMLEVLGVEDVVTAARSPWQNAYAERLIGSLRRECLDHIVVLGEIHLLRILAGYFEYYNRSRCRTFHWWATRRNQAGTRTGTRQGGRASRGRRAASSIGARRRLMRRGAGEGPGQRPTARVVACPGAGLRVLDVNSAASSSPT